MTLHDKTVKRLVSAREVGLKIKWLSDTSKVSLIKIQCLASGNGYGREFKLSDDECERLNNALDYIKGAI